MITAAFNSCDTTQTDSYLQVSQDNTSTNLLQEMQRLTGNTPDTSCYELTIKYNCCYKKTYKFYPEYTFELEYDNDDPDNTIFDILVPSGSMNPALVKIAHLYIWEVNQWVLKETISSTAPGGMIDISFKNINESYSGNTRVKIEITTFCDLTWVIESNDSLTSTVTGLMTPLTITYPTETTDINFINLNTDIEVLPTAFGLGDYVDGVYFVSITKYDYVAASTQILATETWNHTIFRDCKTHCALQQLAHTCNHTLHFFQWFALTKNADCRNLPYKHMCEIWEQIEYAIDYNCKPKNDCNCD